MIDEKRTEAELRAAAHRHQVAQYYNTKVRSRTSGIGDSVLKRIFPGPKSLGPNWKGPYAIKEKLEDDTFKLATVDEILVLRAWNSEHSLFHLETSL